MSEGERKSRWFQVSLGATVLFVTALCVGFALLKSNHPDAALLVTFPFAMGVGIGAVAPRRFAAFALAIIVPPLLMWVVMGTLFHLTWGGDNSLFYELYETIGFVGLELALGVMPAVIGSLISQRLKHGRLFPPILD